MCDDVTDERGNSVRVCINYTEHLTSTSSRAAPTTPRTVLTAPERTMSTNRVVLPRPTSPASTLGAGGNVPNTLAPQHARAPQIITAQSPITPVSSPVAAGAMVADLRHLLSAGTSIAGAERAQTRVSPADIAATVRGIFSPQDSAGVVDGTREAGASGATGKSIGKS